MARAIMLTVDEESGLNISRNGNESRGNIFNVG